MTCGGPVGRWRLTADEDGAGTTAGSIRPRAVGTSDVSVQPSAAACSTAAASKPVVDGERRAGEERPGDDRQAADVGERQAGQPPVGGRVDAERVGWWRAPMRRRRRG